MGLTGVEGANRDIVSDIHHGPTVHVVVYRKYAWSLRGYVISFPFFFPLSFMFSDVPSWKQQQIRYKPHPFPRGQKRPRPTYFLMSERTQSVCGVKSTICHSNPTSAAPFIHRQVVLLTQNNTPAKMKHEGSLSLPSYATIWSRPVGFPY